MKQQKQEHIRFQTSPVDTKEEAKDWWSVETEKVDRKLRKMHGKNGLSTATIGTIYDWLPLPWYC